MSRERHSLIRLAIEFHEGSPILLYFLDNDVCSSYALCLDMSAITSCRIDDFYKNSISDRQCELTVLVVYVEFTSLNQLLLLVVSTS